MVDIAWMAQELHSRTAWQRTPDALTQADYHAMIV